MQDRRKEKNMEETRFDLLPFLRMRFGTLLQPALEHVLMIVGVPCARDGSTIEHLDGLVLEFHRRGEDGSPSVDLQTYGFGDYDPSRPFHEVVLEHLALDEYSWLMIGNIFVPEAAAAIAALHEVPLCEACLEETRSRSN
jgi:hypothetical protein